MFVNLNNGDNDDRNWASRRIDIVNWAAGVTRERHTLEGPYQALIDAVDIARDERTIRNALKNFVAGCGFARYAYLHTLSTGVTTFTDYPFEQALYFRKLYCTVDPVVTTAKRKASMFVWSADDRPLSRRAPAERKFFAEAIDYGIRSGVTIPLEVSFGRTAMLTLATERSRVDTPLLRESQRAAIALAYVHLRLNMIIDGLIDSAGARLSAQEATCLNWSSLGKYMPEIGMIVGIEHRTVQYHLDNARAKLDAVNLPHAVRIAMEKKLLS